MLIRCWQATIVGPPKIGWGCSRERYRNGKGVALVPDVGDLVTVRLVGEISLQPIINNISFTLVAAFGTWREATDQMFADLTAALELDTTGGIWTTGRSSQYVLNTMQVVDVFPGLAPMSQYLIGTGGDVVEDCLPPNDALCVTFRSDFKGPSGRGRMYLSGYPEAAQINGFWTGPTQDLASNIALGLDTNFGELAGAASFRWSVLHRVSGGVPIVPPEVKPVMSFTPHNEVRSLGRRAVGRRIRRTRTGP